MADSQSMRLGLIEITRLADSHGFTWALESQHHRDGKGWMRVTVYPKKEEGR